MVKQQKKEEIMKDIFEIIKKLFDIGIFDFSINSFQYHEDEVVLEIIVEENVLSEGQLKTLSELGFRYLKGRFKKILGKIEVKDRDKTLIEIIREVI